MPLLEEAGIDGFVIAGYVNQGDGKLVRLAMVCTGKNVAVEDGLRSVATFVSMWSAPCQEFNQPSAGETKTDAPKPGDDD